MIRESTYWLQIHRKGDASKARVVGRAAGAPAGLALILV